MGHNGGCHPDEGDPLPSPAHGLAVVLEDESGAVTAELSLVSTATDTPTHIDGATVELSSADFDPLTLPLIAEGTYAAPFGSALSYDPSAPYTFAFSIDEATARTHRASPGTFEITVHGGMDRPTAWMEADDSVAWSPAGQSVWIEVTDGRDQRTYASVDWTDPAIDAAVWKDLPTGGTHHVPAKAFDGVAPHRVRVCAVELFRRDQEIDATQTEPQHAVDGLGMDTGLGWLSGGVAGRCVTIDAR